MSKKLDKKHRCYGCRFVGVAGDEGTCDYILITGKSRSFPNGPDGERVRFSRTEPCPYYEPRKNGGHASLLPMGGPEEPKKRAAKEQQKKDGRTGPRVKWDYVRAKEMFRQGKTLREIAAEFGVSKASVESFAHREGWMMPQGSLEDVEIKK